MQFCTDKDPKRLIRVHQPSEKSTKKSKSEPTSNTVVPETGHASYLALFYKGALQKHFHLGTFDNL